MSINPHGKLTSRLQAGDEVAAAEIVRCFRPRLLALVRRRLDEDVLRRVDPEDVVQSVFHCFFTRLRDGRLVVADADGLWAILCVIAIRRCVNRVEYWRAARRDVRRELRFSDLGKSPMTCVALAREPSPVQTAVLAETLERLMSGLEPRDRAIVTLHLQSYTQAEISQQVGRAERTVRRTLELVRKRLRRMQAADDPQVESGAT